MPKRQSVVRVPSDEVQGEGSWVEVRKPKVGKIREILRRGDDVDDFEAGVELLRDHVVGWNWVDEDGKPLPTPQEDPDVIDDLTTDESEFLSDVLVGTIEKRKNLPSSSP